MKFKSFAAILTFFSLLSYTLILVLLMTGNLVLFWNDRNTESAELNFGHLLINEQVQDDLEELWLISGKKEYSVCIKGEQQIGSDERSEFKLVSVDDDTFVMGKETWSYQAECDEMAVIHKHPSVGCRNQLWSGDVAAAKRAYSDGVIFYLIQCSPTEIEVYTREDMWFGIIVDMKNGKTTELNNDSQ